MKWLLIILSFIIVVLIIISGWLILLNLDFKWIAQDFKRDLRECSQELINSDQKLRTELNRQGIIEYKENLEYIEIYSEEEFNEIYAPPTEEVYVEPVKELVCVDWVFEIGNDNYCTKWL